MNYAAALLYNMFHNKLLNKSMEEMAMGIFDNVFENVKSVADIVGKKANKVVDVSKLKLSVNELNGEIKKRYAELGEYIYNAKKNGDYSEECITEKIQEIDDLSEQLAAVQDAISTLLNRVYCPECGKAVSINDAFCSACGAKLPVHEAPVVEEPAEDEAEETAEEDVVEAEVVSEVEIEDNTEE